MSLIPITKAQNPLGFGSSYKTRWDCQSGFFNLGWNSPLAHSLFLSQYLLLACEYSIVNINSQLHLTFTMASLLQGSAFVTGAASGKSKLKSRATNSLIFFFFFSLPSFRPSYLT